MSYFQEAHVPLESKYPRCRPGYEYEIEAGWLCSGDHLQGTADYNGQVESCETLR